VQSEIPKKMMEKGGRKKYITERNGRSSLESSHSALGTDEAT